MLLTAGDDVRFGMPPLRDSLHLRERDSLHLREAAIHEQFRYRDVALLPPAMFSMRRNLAAVPRHLRLVRT